MQLQNFDPNVLGSMKLNIWSWSCTCNHVKPLVGKDVFFNFLKQFFLRLAHLCQNTMSHEGDGDKG